MNSSPDKQTPGGAWRWEAAFLLAAVAAALAARLPFLMHGLDEWDSVNFALSIVQFSVPIHQPHPPGQFFYVKAMQALSALVGGNDLFALSLASAVGGSLALVPYYLALRQIFRPGVAMGATVLTMWTFGYWITSLRMISDPVAGLFVYGTVCALLAGLKNARWYLGGMILCGVALGTKQSAAYFLAPFVAAVSLLVWHRHGWRRPLLGSVLFAVVVAAWLLPTVQNCHGWVNYVALCQKLQQENHATESIIFHLSADALKSQGEETLLQPWGATALAAVMLPLAALGLIVCCRRGVRGALFALFGLSLVGYAFFFFFRFNKYYAYYVPVYCAFAAAAVFAAGDWLGRRTRRQAVGSLASWLAIGGLTAANIALTAPLLGPISHFRSPPQAALESLHKLPGVEAAPLVLADDDATRHELRYFHLKKTVDLLNLHPDLRTAAAALNAGRKVYLLSAFPFDTVSDQPDTVRQVGSYVWKPALFQPLQGRGDLRQLSLYEVTAPLPADYVFEHSANRPPLLLEGMWEDGWCGRSVRVLLPRDPAGHDLVWLQGTSPENFGYHYPYQLVCQFDGGPPTELNVERPGHFDFVVPIPDGPAAPTVEMELAAPASQQPSQLDARVPDSRDLALHLEALRCVNDSRPLLVEYGEGWYALETDGKARWRWSDGNGTLVVLTSKPGSLVLTGEIGSMADGNVIELLVDGQPTGILAPSGTERQAVRWSLPLTPGVHRVTLHSRLPGIKPPGDSRALAVQVRDWRWQWEP